MWIQPYHPIFSRELGAVAPKGETHEGPSVPKVDVDDACLTHGTDADLMAFVVAVEQWRILHNQHLLIKVWSVKLPSSASR